MQKRSQKPVISGHLCVNIFMSIDLFFSAPPKSAWSDSLNSDLSNRIIILLNVHGVLSGQTNSHMHLRGFRELKVHYGKF